MTRSLRNPETSELESNGALAASDSLSSEVLEESSLVYPSVFCAMIRSTLRALIIFFLLESVLSKTVPTPLFCCSVQRPDCASASA